MKNKSATRPVEVLEVSNDGLSWVRMAAYDMVSKELVQSMQGAFIGEMFLSQRVRTILVPIRIDIRRLL